MSAHGDGACVVVMCRPKWRNWQTRMVQVHVPSREWRFKSSHPHQLHSFFDRATLIAVLPLAHRPVLKENPRHWLRAAEWVLGQSCLGEIESQPWFFSQRVLAVYHAHRREAKPLEPNLVTRLGHDIPAALLDEEIRYR